MTDPAVTKAQTETYRIRTRNNWADITIYEPAGPRTGGMQIHSDFGDWAFSWYDHGCKSFKHFILEPKIFAPYFVPAIKAELET